MPVSRHSQRTVPIRIGADGLAPVTVMAAAFATFALETGLPVVMAALLGAVGIAASLLVHEFGHVRAARRVAGIRVVGISLIWLGAATRFEGGFENGREQARVAIAGPGASFAFALSLVALCVLPMPTPVKEAVLFLALFNVALAVMNLVPAYPLDGYKVAVGLLWSATGSEKKARKIIRRIGMGCAAIELPSAVFLLAQRPQLGVAVAVMAGGFVAQQRFVARKRLASKPTA
jgi:Zn-dependent protease